MTTLNILNSFELSSDGVSNVGKQGTSTSGLFDVLALTSSTTPALAGTTKYVKGSLATATVNTVWATATDFPATFDYLYFWADQIMYIQVIGTATNATFKIGATIPFVLAGYGSVLAAANTTIITGGAEPSVTALTKVVLGNYSGSTANYLLAIID